MESNLDKPMAGFGIENTIEMGAGNPELLNDLFAPETSTEDPDKLEDITKKVEDTPTKTSPAKKVKEIKGDEEEEEEESEKKEDDSIYKFLTGDEEEEEEEEEVKPTVKKTEEKVEEEEEKPTTQFSALANDLFSLGVFTKDENEDDVKIDTPEQFLERFNDEKKKGAIQMVNEFIGQFGEDYQQAFDAIYVKGVSPKTYFSTSNEIQDLQNIDMSNEDNQVAVMRRALADQGFEPEDITSEIDRLKNYGDLESVSQKHHKVLVKKEATNLQRIQEEAQQAQQFKAQQKSQYINNVQQVLNDKLKTRDFDGIPINPKLANELQDFLLVDKYKTTSGEKLTDFDRTILELKRPENHEMKVKVGLLLKLLEKDPTLSTIKKTAVTSKNDKLFSSLAKQVTTDKSSIGSRTKTGQSIPWNGL